MLITLFDVLNKYLRNGLVGNSIKFGSSSFIGLNNIQIFLNQVIDKKKSKIKKPIAFRTQYQTPSLYILLFSVNKNLKKQRKKTKDRERKKYTQDKISEKKIEDYKNLYKSEWCATMVWILKLLTDYSVPAQRWFQWKPRSTWMCCTWALNLVHVKKTSPTFYCEIAIELSRPYYWMMNVRTRHPHNYHGDDSKTSDWNFQNEMKKKKSKIKWNERKIGPDKNKNINRNNLTRICSKKIKRK